MWESGSRPSGSIEDTTMCLITAQFVCCREEDEIGVEREEELGLGEQPKWNLSLSNNSTMAVRSLAGAQSKPTPSTSKQPAADSTLTRISHLAALLPPSAPTSASLNPLADLVDLYQNLSLSPPTTASTKDRERNRQEVHAALHTLKGVFEALIKQGRLHGVLKNAKRVRVDTAEGRKEVAKEDATVQKVKEWLKERWEEYLAKTAQVVGGHWDGTVRVRCSSSRPGIAELTFSDFPRFPP